MPIFRVMLRHYARNHRHRRPSVASLRFLYFFFWDILSIFDLFWRKLSRGRFEECQEGWEERTVWKIFAIEISIIQGNPPRLVRVCCCDLVYLLFLSAVSGDYFSQLWCLIQADYSLADLDGDSNGQSGRLGWTHTAAGTPSDRGEGPRSDCIFLIAHLLLCITWHAPSVHIVTRTDVGVCMETFEWA